MFKLVNFLINFRKNISLPDILFAPLFCRNLANEVDLFQLLPEHPLLLLL